MEQKNPFQVLIEEGGESYAAFGSLIDALQKVPDGLDAKTWQLVYIGIQASRGDVGSVCGHTGLAKAAGATRGEVKNAILISLMVSGISNALNILGPALAAYDA
jgi:alkylhydroperoxidase/carboxymuconolactone decarboxylase family protein YurZ